MGEIEDLTEEFGRHLPLLPKEGQPHISVSTKKARRREHMQRLREDADYRAAWEAEKRSRTR